MKKLIFLTLLIPVVSFSFAQAPLSMGQNQFNAGLGFSSWGLPVYVGFDHGVHPDITVGGEISFRSFSERFKGYDYNHTVIGIAGNGNYHFNRILQIPKDWDFYAGLNVGFYIWNNPSDYPGDHTSGLGLGAQIGGRYYFNRRVGINLEFGGGNAFSNGKIGVTWKI